MYKETGIYQLAHIARKRYIGQTGNHFICGLMNLSVISRTLTLIRSFPSTYAKINTFEFVDEIMSCTSSRRVVI
jgi:hypothetical protein